MTTPGVESAKIIALERAVIVSGGVVSGLAAGVSASLGFFLKPITEALGFGREVIGLATGLSFFLNGFASIGWGAVADTRGAGAALACGVVLEACALILTSAARAAPAFYLSVGLEGVATAALSFGVILGEVARLVAPARRARALGYTSSVFSSGLVVVPPAVAALLAARGWSGALWLLALGSLGMAPCAAAFCAAGRALRRHRARYYGAAAAEASPADGAAPPARSSLRAALRLAADTRDFKLLVAGFSV